MKLAVMQPYFFPYLGYYQLAAGVDRFVFLDDAAFITRGFIHRNQLLLDGRPYRFTLPVAQASQNRSIAEHRFAGSPARFLQQLRHGYARAAQFQAVYRLVESAWAAGNANVARVCAASIHAVFDYLGLPLHSADASALAVAGRGQDRIVALCQQLGARAYHNLPGGRALYAAEAFHACGAQLYFLQPQMPPYQQGHEQDFVPGLSMIDVLMHNPPERVRQMLGAARLEPAA
ncbi:MAG TPA: WbqC family protein [Stenotrophomonas sp.]|nr:WbqC family protein [Stenotrophomonas sp.]